MNALANALAVIQSVNALAERHVSPYNVRVDKLLRCAITRLDDGSLEKAMALLKATDVAHIAYARNLVVTRLSGFDIPVEACISPFCSLCEIPLTEEQFMRMMGAPTFLKDDKGTEHENQGQ